MKAKAAILTVSAVLLLAAGGIFAVNYINSNPDKITDNQESSAYNETVTTEETTTEPFIPPVFVECSTDDIHKGKLILVNRDNEYVKRSNTEITDIYSLKSDAYEVNTVDMQLDRTMILAINNMLDDFKAATGISDVLANSGFRSYDEQKIMYDNDLEVTGKQYSELVAPPGFSEHHTGYAMDFAINDGYSYPALKNEGEYSWIYDNAHKYGMILRYTEENKHITGYMAESWHFRYVGEPHATLIRTMGLAYEEYVNFLKDYSFECPLEYKYSDTEFYKIYFVKADFETGLTDVPVSYEAFQNADNGYTISGNNVDGFIVTLKTSELSDDYDDSFLYMFRPLETSVPETSSGTDAEVADDSTEGRADSSSELSESDTQETDEPETSESVSESEGW